MSKTLKHITLTVAEFRTLAQRIAYHPHPRVGKGRLFCTGVEGVQPHHDTYVYIHNHALLDLTGHIALGRWVMIGAGAYLITHTHDFTGRRPLLLKEVEDPSAFTTPLNKHIRDDVWIFKSVIGPKCQYIAAGVVVGVGSVVTKDILIPYSIWAGNPARQVGSR